MLNTNSDPSEGIIAINNFVFCFTHGSEVCNKCFIDLRVLNNIRMEKRLKKAFPKMSEIDFEDRPPLSNALLLALDSGKKDPDGLTVYQCKHHSTVDCKTCFDWTRTAIDLLKKAVSNRNAIAIETTREQKLAFLKSMGVELSPTTRLPVEAIDKKLRGAIDASQDFSTVVDWSPVNSSSLSIWTAPASDNDSMEDENRGLYKAVRRGNFEEARRNYMAVVMGMDNAFPLYENAFTDVRQSVMALARNVDLGYMETILQDKDENYAICLRVLEVRKISDVPILVVAYGRGTHNSPLNSTLEWIEDVLRRNSSKTAGFGTITATPEEQNLLLTILHLNSKRLSPNYVPSRRETEKTFMVSFLLPLGPLTQVDIGRLSNHSGCTVCGSKTVSRCSSCLSVEYCGQECQKAHWKEHKPMCNNLKGGTWHNFNMCLHSPEMRREAAKAGKPIYGLFWNNTESINKDKLQRSRMEIKPDGPDGDVAPNVHGDTPFVVKIQCPATLEARARGGSMMIYDRQRTFQAYMSNEEGTAYREAMKQPEMAVKGKIYRWAKRFGEGENRNRLSVCFDKPLAKDPAW